MPINARWGHLMTVGGAVCLASACGWLATQTSGYDGGPWLWWVAVVAFLVAAPLVIRWFALRREHLTVLPLVSAFFLLEFVAGGLFYRVPRKDSVIIGIYTSYTEAAMQPVMMMAFAAWAMIVAGYVAFGPLARAARSLPRPSVEDRSLLAVAAILWTVGLLARIQMVRLGYYFHFSADGSEAGGGTLRQIVTISANLPMIATALVAAAYYKGLTTRGVLLALVAVEVAWALPSGERARVIILALALLVVRYYSSPKPFPTRAALIGVAVAVFVIFPFGALYRGAAFGTTASDFQADPVANAKRAATTMLTSPPHQTARMGVEETLRRFSGTTSIATMIRKGRDLYPTTPDQATATWAGAWVPRTLLPTKSDPSTVANEFGRNYGILFRTIRNSAVAMTTVGDLYGTFGLWPMLLLMGVIGGILRAIAEYFYDLRTNPASLGMYATVIGGLLLGFEATVALGLLQSLRELAVYVVAVYAAIATARFLRPARRPAYAR